jgi:hypothetical protein
MPEKLKPCPFCGGSPDVGGDRVGCGNGECPLSRYLFRHDEWNRRATDEAVKKAREALGAVRYSLGWKEKGNPGTPPDELVHMVDGVLAALKEVE